jgi:hypothetical protein
MNFEDIVFQWTSMQRCREQAILVDLLFADMNGVKQE